MSLDVKAGGGGNKPFLEQMEPDFLVCDVSVTHGKIPSYIL